MASLLSPEAARAQDEEFLAMPGMSAEDEGAALLGKRAPAFGVMDIEGNVFRSDELAGKVIVMNFWFVRCQPCLKEMPELNELAGEYTPRDDVLFIAPTFDNRETVAKFLKQKKFAYRLATDATGLITDFGINGYPTNIVIDKKGNYLLRLMGYDANIKLKLKQAIESALKAE